LLSESSCQPDASVDRCFKSKQLYRVVAFRLELIDFFKYNGQLIPSASGESCVLQSLDCKPGDMPEFGLT